MHMDYIMQVEYTVHPVNDHVFEIKQTNTRDDVTTHRVFMPQCYQKQVVKFLWRFSLLIKLYQKFHKRTGKKYKAFLPRLCKILVHLDNVIEALIRPAVGLLINEVAKYHSRNFDEYLVTEFLIGRHDPISVNEFRATYDVNIERMTPADFGKCTYRFLSVILSTNQFVDWDAYNGQRIHPLYEGSEYTYTVPNVPSNELLDLWDLVAEHYARPLDHDWGTHFSFVDIVVASFMRCFYSISAA